MAVGKGYTTSRSLQDTPTWALATVCLIFIALSLFIEQLIHLLCNVRLYTCIHTHTHTHIYYSSFSLCTMSGWSWCSGSKDVEKMPYLRLWRNSNQVGFFFFFFFFFFLVFRLIQNSMLMIQILGIFFFFWAVLILLGFMSLLLAVTQRPISKICITNDVAYTMLPCRKPGPTKTSKSLGVLLDVSSTSSYTNGHFFGDFQPSDHHHHGGRRLAGSDSGASSDDHCESQVNLTL